MRKVCGWALPCPLPGFGQRAFLSGRKQMFSDVLLHLVGDRIITQLEAECLLADPELASEHADHGPGEGFISLMVFRLASWRN